MTNRKIAIGVSELICLPLLLVGGTGLIHSANWYESVSCQPSVEKGYIDPIFRRSAFARINVLVGLLQLTAGVYWIWALLVGRIPFDFSRADATTAKSGAELVDALNSPTSSPALESGSVITVPVVPVTGSVNPTVLPQGVPDFAIPPTNTEVDERVLLANLQSSGNLERLSPDNRQQLLQFVHKNTFHNIYDVFATTQKSMLWSAVMGTGKTTDQRALVLARLRSNPYTAMRVAGTKADTWMGLSSIPKFLTVVNPDNPFAVLGPVEWAYKAAVHRNTKLSEDERRQCPPVVVILDDLIAMLGGFIHGSGKEYTEGFKEFKKMCNYIITTGREGNVFLQVANHTFYLEGLGLAGDSNIRDCLLTSGKGAYTLNQKTGQMESRFDAIKRMLEVPSIISDAKTRETLKAQAEMFYKLCEATLIPIVLTSAGGSPRMYFMPYIPWMDNYQLPNVWIERMAANLGIRDFQAVSGDSRTETLPELSGQSIVLPGTTRVVPSAEAAVSVSVSGATSARSGSFIPDTSERESETETLSATGLLEWMERMDKAGISFKLAKQIAERWQPENPKKPAVQDEVLVERIKLLREQNLTKTAILAALFNVSPGGAKPEPIRGYEGSPYYVASAVYDRITHED